MPPTPFNTLCAFVFSPNKNTITLMNTHGKNPSKGPHTLCRVTVQRLHKKLKWMFSGAAQVSHQVCQFFCQFCVSSCACDYGG
jgi:hypothetical protein